MFTKTLNTFPEVSPYTFDLLFDTSDENQAEKTADCSLRTSFCQQELTDNLMKLFKLSKSIQSLTWQLNNEPSPTNQFGHINGIQKRWELTEELDVPPAVFHFTMQSQRQRSWTMTGKITYTDPAS